MANAGEYERLRDLRMHFQHLNEEQFAGDGRGDHRPQVRAFVSGIDTKRDVSAELFYLEPRG